MDELWGITTLFNPNKREIWRKNYDVFRARVNVPLVAAELSFDGRFELGDADAEITLRFDGGDVLWQKERLFNLALSSVPISCKKVVLLDCDVVFEKADWAEHTAALLDRAVMVQPFDSVHHLPRRCLADGTIGDEHFFRASLAFQQALGNPGLAAPGGACAFRREVLEAHGVYDVCPLGGGDSAIGLAAYGHLDAAVELLHMNAAWAAHYQAWATRFFGAVRGRVAWVPGRLISLWHGELSARRFGTRSGELSAFDYDPRRDIREGPSRCWVWSSPKTALHRHVQAYFQGLAAEP